MEGEINFSIKEISSDEFILSVWKEAKIYGKYQIASFSLGPNEYAELTTTLVNFGQEQNS